jgi:hypothetical protein
MVKRWQHTRGSNSMRAGGRGEAKSRRHVARRSHGDVVRVGHGFTGQLTLGRSPDCLVAGRRAQCDRVWCRVRSAIGHRPPSPARAAVSNANTVVAGEGRGWGNNKLPSWWMACDRHQPYVAELRWAASTWSTALPPSSHAVRASGRSERRRSRTVATSTRGWRRLLRSRSGKTRDA